MFDHLFMDIFVLPFPFFLNDSRSFSYFHHFYIIQIGRLHVHFITPQGTFKISAIINFSVITVMIMISGQFKFPGHQRTEAYSQLE